jgi:hypothetical protein
MFRSLRLTQVAVQAELLRLRRMLQRSVTRLVMVLIAVPFLLATFGFLETALWTWLSRIMLAPFAALVQAGVNIVVAAVFLIMAAVSSESRVEIEALQVRQRALEDAGRQMRTAALLGPALGIVLEQLRRSRSRR